MWKRLFFMLLAVAAAGCRTTPAQTNLPPQPYTRIANPDSNTVQLQIAIRKFVPEHRRGPAIWLVGASHIGEPAYYRTLQNYLDARDIVLYEGINTQAHKRHVHSENLTNVPPLHESEIRDNARPHPNPLPQEREKNSRADGSGVQGAKTGSEKSLPQGEGEGKTTAQEGFSMQSALAKSLGLVFQLDAIDYDRTNFINSDLSVLQIERLMIGDTNAQPVAPGQPGRSSPSFDALLQVMDGSSFLGGLLKLAVQFIGSNPNLQAITRLMFIDAIGNLKGDFSEIQGLPSDMQRLLKVLIEARNQNVVDDLKAELKTVPRSGSIAVFYGTGHMDNMEKEITRQLHYRPDGDIWLTVFSVDLRQTGLAPAQIQMLRAMVKAQLDQMQP